MSTRRTHSRRAGESPAKWRAGGKDEAKGDARRRREPPAAAGRPTGCAPAPQSARVQLRAGQSGSAPCPPLPPTPPSGKRGRQGKMGCWGAESPAPEYGSDLPHRPMEDERDKQTFLFGLWAQPGSHERRHPPPQARMGASPTPIADAGRAFSRPHDPLRPPAASDWRIPSCLTPNVTLSPSPLSPSPLFPAPHRIVRGNSVLNPVPLPSRGLRPLPRLPHAPSRGPRSESLGVVHPRGSPPSPDAARRA